MNKKLLNLLPYKIVNDHINSQIHFSEESREVPKLYNSKGEQVKIFYLKNSLNSHTPYSMVAGRISDRILWDRFNQGLPVHFYNHKDMQSTSKYAEKKFGILRESEAIVPEDYNLILNNPSLVSEFDKIFTHNEEILNKYENALFVPAYGVWYGTERFGGLLSDKTHELKNKNISFISSDKTISDFHKVRILLAKKYVHNTAIDGYGKAFNNFIEKKADALTNYRYSIIVENGSSPYYFTEKILDCFASMTVPIYLGATKIGDFFNTDSIITFTVNDVDDFDNIIKQCSKEDYLNRLPAIIDNYNRVQKYLSFEDYILDNYGGLFIG